MSWLGTNSGFNIEHKKNRRIMELVITNENGVLTGLLNGRLDTISCEKFGKDIQPLMDNADKTIVLDCSGLQYICSSGLRLFLTLRKKTGEMGGKLTILHINNEIRSVFTITGFFGLFDIR